MKPISTRWKLAGFAILAVSLLVLVAKDWGKSGTDRAGVTSPERTNEATALPRQSRQSDFGHRRIAMSMMGDRVALPPEIVGKKREKLSKEQDVAGLAALFLLSDDPTTRQLLKEHSENPTACRVLALAGETPEERLKWAEQLRSVAPEDPSGLVFQASALFDVGRTEEGTDLLLSMSDDENLKLADPALLQTQQTLWKEAGESHADAGILAAESGYGVRLLNNISTLVTRFSLEGAEVDSERGAAVATKSLSLIAGLRGELGEPKSIIMEKRLLESEVRSLENFPPDIEYVESMTIADRLKELNLRRSDLDAAHQFISSTLIQSDLKLVEQFAEEVNRNGLRSAAKNVLGASDEVAKAFIRN